MPSCTVPCGAPKPPHIYPGIRYGHPFHTARFRTTEGMTRGSPLINDGSAFKLRFSDCIMFQSSAGARPGALSAQEPVNCDHARAFLPREKERKPQTVRAAKASDVTPHRRN